MKTKKQINRDIVLLTMKIGEKTPELMKYLDEMPEMEWSKAEEEITTQNLWEYYLTLKALTRNYRIGVNL
jgi:hypothetical protein